MPIIDSERNILGVVLLINKKVNKFLINGDFMMKIFMNDQSKNKKRIVEKNMNKEKQING